MYVSHVLPFYLFWLLLVPSTPYSEPGSDIKEVQPTSEHEADLKTQTSEPATSESRCKSFSGLIIV